MSSDTPPRNLVWVTVGKTQHPAFLLDSGEQGNLVKWTSNQKTEWIDSDDIQLELSPRRRRSRQSLSEDASVALESPSPAKMRSPSPSKRRREKVRKENKEPQPSQETKVTADLKTAPLSLAGSTERGDDDDDDDESDIEILFTIQPPTPKRPRSAEKKSSPVRPKPPEKKSALAVTTSSSDDGVQSFIPTSEDPEPNRPGTDGERCSPVEQEVTTNSFLNDSMRVDVAAAVEEDTEPNILVIDGEQSTPMEQEASTNSFSNDSVRADVAAEVEKDFEPNKLVIDGDRCTPMEQEVSTNSSLNDSTRANIAAGVEEDTEPVQYTLTSSAYMQNLAEICYTITQDRRWRIGASLQPLLQWESGQDLSAVTLLSRRFQPTNRNEKKVSQCTCLLCREKKGKDPELDTDTEIEIEKPVSPEEESSNDDSDEEEERCLYLYCRLFYRKGPWFRLDDIYSKYYAPKKKSASFGQLAQEQEEPATKEPPNASKKHFFRPHMTDNQAKRKSSDSSIDPELLQQHIERMSLLLSDMVRLRSIGLIRSFSGEEECGKTVGVTLITAEERASVLNKIGGEKKNRGTNENEIWKQMSRQRSIFAKSSSGSGAERSVLPVLKHVDEVLLDRLSRTIVQACSRTEYIPAPIMRLQTAVVKDAFRSAVSKLATDLKPHTCFRLREAPLLALQRCARLYLCATSGPGEMRGNGSNGWKSLLNVEANPPLAKMIPPPGLQSFHQVSYPSLMHRFGVTSSSFIDAYHGLPVEDLEDSASSLFFDQVFVSMSSFKAWELSVELRAHVDYLVELNETMRIEQRRQARGARTSSESRPNMGTDSVDFLDLLTSHGRERVLFGLLQACCEGPSQEVAKLTNDIHRDLEELTLIEDECEHVLGVIAIIAIHILRFRNTSIEREELRMMADRPWLRHMWWDGCLAYILWDIIPILERRGLYKLAVHSLSTLVYGPTAERPGEGSLFALPTGIPMTLNISPLLLSRRATGKAYDRLVIDCAHISRKENKELSGDAKRSETVNTQAQTSQFCEDIIRRVVHSSSIAFSAIRGIARRLKRPLCDTLADLTCLEANELGLRLNNVSHSEKEVKASKTYSDWTPPTDFTVGNAIVNDETEAGGRCAFVGFEEEGIASGNAKSLNVEQLALEFYNTGRLPISEDPDIVLGGWVGWHDEGSKIRALFRILCSASLLGMDWGCTNSLADGRQREGHSTIHLSPYQGAPFDLHVGYELRPAPAHDAEAEIALIPSKSFYFRRRATIETFLGRLTKLKGQELCDLVHASVASRLRYATVYKRKDPSIERDLKQVRTLSFMAAGCGGTLLAAVFRCFLFDYRHYSGGLPDLTLVRSVYDDTRSIPDGLVDLGEWIGEGFHQERLEERDAQRAAAMLEDDEFLGCSKMGDSGGQSRFNRSRSTQSQNAPARILSMDDLPSKLELVHAGRQVKVECMMVEVKSSNDRLDPRQEDWLNVLDRYGNARVCKFEDSSKVNKKRKPTKKESMKSN